MAPGDMTQQNKVKNNSYLQLQSKSSKYKYVFKSFYKYADLKDLGPDSNVSNNINISQLVFTPYQIMA